MQKTFFSYSVLAVEQRGGFPEKKVVSFVLRGKKTKKNQKPKPTVCRLP